MIIRDKEEKTCRENDMTHDLRMYEQKHDLRSSAFSTQCAALLTVRWKFSTQFLTQGEAIFFERVGELRESSNRTPPSTQSTTACRKSPDVNSLIRLQKQTFSPIVVTEKPIRSLLRAWPPP